MCLSNLGGNNTGTIWNGLKFVSHRMSLTSDDNNETIVGDFEMLDIVNETILFANIVLEKSNSLFWEEMFAMINLKRWHVLLADLLLNVVICMCGISDDWSVAVSQRQVWWCCKNWHFHWSHADGYIHHGPLSQKVNTCCMFALMFLRDNLLSFHS